MYMCMHTYIHIYICIFIYTYLHQYTYIHLPTYMYIYICVYLYVYMCIYIHLYSYKYSHARLHIYMYCATPDWRQSVFYLPNALVVSAKDVISGSLTLQPSAKNHRFLSVAVLCCVSMSLRVFFHLSNFFAVSVSLFVCTILSLSLSICLFVWPWRSLCLTNDSLPKLQRSGFPADVYSQGQGGRHAKCYFRLQDEIARRDDATPHHTHTRTFAPAHALIFMSIHAHEYMHPCTVRLQTYIYTRTHIFLVCAYTCKSIRNIGPDTYGGSE